MPASHLLSYLDLYFLPKWLGAMEGTGGLGPAPGEPSLHESLGEGGDSVNGTT